MADEKYDAALDALEDAIKIVADRVGAANSAASVESLSSAARQLTEARAWMIRVDQPHGSTSSVSVASK